MKTTMVKFGSVPVGGFFFIDGLGWLFKASLRSAYVGAKAECNRYAPRSGDIVRIVA